MKKYTNSNTTQMNVFLKSIFNITNLKFILNHSNADSENHNKRGKFNASRKFNVFQILPNRTNVVFCTTDGFRFTY